LRPLENSLKMREKYFLQFKAKKLKNALKIYDYKGYFNKKPCKICELKIDIMFIEKNK